MPARRRSQEGVPTERVEFPPPPPNLPSAPPAKKKGLSAGAIAGIVLACVLIPGGLFAGVVGYSMYKRASASEVSATRLRARRCLDAITARIVSEGPIDGRGCPSSLRAMVPRYLKPEMIKDAWGYDLRLRCESKRICVYSAGRNHKDEQGGGDDLQVCTDSLRPGP